MYTIQPISYSYHYMMSPLLCAKSLITLKHFLFSLFVPVTLQCTRNGGFVLVVARDATLPHISLDSIHLLEDDPPGHCASVGSTATFAIYQFAVSSCGTRMKVGVNGGSGLQGEKKHDTLLSVLFYFLQEENGFIIYENIMSSSYEVGIGPRGSISRDSYFE